jgi:hypothetical protein
MNRVKAAKLYKLVFSVTLAVGILCACSVPSPNSNSSVAPSIDNGLEIVYFHRAQRCAGCIHAQDMTEYTLNTYFAEELQSGDIVFVALNLQDAANAAMVQKYGAYTSSLFINDVEEGVEQIEQITDIWLVLWDDEEFVEIVKTEIEEHLAD